ncbi:MAG: hypothetical protein SGPRY_014741, partial [Prymnesium sp.]
GPATADAVSDELRSQLHKQQYMRVRLVNYDKEGTPFYNCLECFPLRDSFGEVSYYCGVLQREEIGDAAIPKLDRGLHSFALQHKQEPENSVRKRDRDAVLAEALENSTDAIVITGSRPPYPILHVNQAWSEMCGYSAEVRGL